MDYKPLSDEEALELGRELVELTDMDLYSDTILISLGRIAFKLVHRIDEGRE